jgi:hypothetical protein
MKTFSDFNGTPLQIGDTVNFVAPGYRMLALGYIVAFTAQKVRVAYSNTWNYGPTGYPQELLQTSDQLIKLKNN